MYKYCIAIHVIFIGYTIKCLYMKIRTCMGLNKILKKISFNILYYHKLVHVHSVVFVLFSFSIVFR